MALVRKEQIGQATLYLGDSAEILPELPCFPAIITDPPYGIGADSAQDAQGLANINAKPGSKASRGWKYYGSSNWDDTRPPKELFDLMLERSELQIIWGGNYFSDYLPPSMQWIIWDKCQRNFTLADAEMAWSSQWKATRIYSLSRGAALQDGRIHPTQKPVRLMKYCIIVAGHPKIICDPFMGSGTTGVAAVEMGLDFVGIEREEKYFQMACERIEEAQKQLRLFV